MTSNLWRSALTTGALCVLMTAPTLVVAETSPAKKELIAKAVQLQSPAIEAFARFIAEQPVGMLMQAAGRELQAQHRDIAVAALAEGEVGAGNDATCPDQFDQPLLGKGARRQARERGVEAEDEHRVGPCLREQPLTLVERCQTEGQRIRP